jgi:hypothetical protein
VVFFRSASFDIDTLYRKLITVFLKVVPPKTIGGRVVLAGDSIKREFDGNKVRLLFGPKTAKDQACSVTSCLSATRIIARSEAMK